MTQDPQRKLDEYGAEEMAIPEWRVIQKVGGDLAKELGASPGQFYNTINDQIADELNIIVVDIMTGRTRWGEEIKNVGPLCASMDARTNESIYGDDCSKCEFRLDSPWSADVAERRKKCCLNYTVLGIDLDHDYLPVMLRAHGISALPARQLITQLKMNRALRGEYFKAVVNVKSVAKDTPYGTAYALHPKITELITDKAKAEELRIESNRLLGAPIPLPEGRPEEEGEPLGFTPTGTPFYSEEERARLMGEEGLAQPAIVTPPVTTLPVAVAGETPKAGKEKGKEPTKVLDLDF